jgi:hypothetical protein
LDHLTKYYLKNEDNKDVLNILKNEMNEMKNDTIKSESKNKAKIVAELNALEQAQINIQSYSELQNLNLTRDEIITITAGILNVTDVKYKLTNEGNILVMTAIVTAEIDTDKIPELVEREIKRRANKN